VQTNVYGSFSGSFTAPRDRLTGLMTIMVADGPPGATDGSVEEYKGPKFNVALSPPSEPARLGARIKVPGQTTTFAGVPVGGAKVEYRVHREVRYSFSDASWQPAQLIAHKFATTESSGAFALEFLARPDPSVPEKDEPSFVYTITANVTDQTGETRSATSVVEVGYTTLRATVSAAEWQTVDKAVRFALSTATLDGLGQETKGTLKIYRLKQPAEVIRPEFFDSWQDRERLDPDGPPPEPILPVRQRGLLEHRATWPKRWDSGELVHTAEFKSDGHGKAAISVKLPAGAYRAVVETADRFNKPVTARTALLVLDPGAERLAIKVPVVFASPSWSVESGSEFVFHWATGYAEGRTFIQIEHRGKLLRAFWTEPGKTLATLKLPVTEELRGGFTVRAVFVHDNRAHFFSRKVEVPWTNKQLTVKWETFRSKLEPGRKETFSAVISGPDAKRAVAEMVASLYDKSLDEFLPHGWYRSFDLFHEDDSSVAMNFENVPEWFHELHGEWASKEKVVGRLYRYLDSKLTNTSAMDDEMRAWGRNTRVLDWGAA